jgi:hypothetical protein
MARPDFGVFRALQQTPCSTLEPAQGNWVKGDFVFARSQYLQLQEEYFKVGLHFELFSRALGEFNLLHEDQIRDNQLADYQVLVLCDVKHLAEEGANNIERFVRRGGVVIADCVSQLNEYKKPLNTVTPIFGVRRAATERSVQEGHWIPYSTRDPVMANADLADTNRAQTVFAVAAGKAFGHPCEFKVATPRACKVSAGKVRAKAEVGPTCLNQPEDLPRQDVESGEAVPNLTIRDGIEFPITTAFGSTRLLRISP